MSAPATTGASATTGAGAVPPITPSLETIQKLAQLAFCDTPEADAIAERMMREEEKRQMAARPKMSPAEKAKWGRWAE